MSRSRIEVSPACSSAAVQFTSVAGAAGGAVREHAGGAKYIGSLGWAIAAAASPNGPRNNSVNRKN